MTNPIEPATDEEIEEVRRLHRYGHAASRRETGILLARIDAEKARAEKAEAERDRLVAALELVSLRTEPDGPCWCVVRAGPHHLSCLRARALLTPPTEKDPHR